MDTSACVCVCALQRVLAAAQLNMQRQEGLKSKEEAAAVRRELSSLNVDPDRLLPAGLKPLFLQVNPVYEF
eukprot:1162092-Pelagomonas_calceolata.AAC.7